MSNQIQLDNPLVGILVIIVVIILSLILQQQIQAKFDKKKLEICHEVGSYYMSAVGTLYAIILGLVVNDASIKYDDARKYIEQETNALIQVYTCADSLSEASKLSIHGKLTNYVHDVINVEWDKMALREPRSLSDNRYECLIFCGAITQKKQDWACKTTSQITHS